MARVSHQKKSLILNELSKGTPIDVLSEKHAVRKPTIESWQGKLGSNKLISPRHNSFNHGKRRKITSTKARTNDKKSEEYVKIILMLLRKMLKKEN